MQQGNEIKPEVWAQVLEQFEKIKSDSGIEPELDYIKQLEDMLGMSVEEMNRETEITLRTKRLGVELIHEDAKFPSNAYPSDSGFDLYSTIDYKLSAFGRALIPTGIKLSIPDEYEIQVRPKSGLAIKQGLTVLNTPGTVDQGYTGEIQVIVFNTNNTTVTIPKGMKVGQGVLCPVVQGKSVMIETVEKVEDKDRGNNGFGSTGI